MNKVEDFLIIKQIMKNTCHECAKYPCSFWKSGDLYKAALLAKRLWYNNSFKLKKLEVDQNKLLCFVSKIGEK